MSNMGRNKPPTMAREFPVLESLGATKEQADNYWNNRQAELSRMADDAAKGGGGDAFRQQYMQRHMKLEPWKYDRAYSEFVARQGAQLARQDIGRHTGWKAGMNAGYKSGKGVFGGSWLPKWMQTPALRWMTQFGGPIADIRDMWLARNYVDQDWLDKAQDISSNDPLEVIRRAGYRHAVNQGVQPKLEALSRQESAAAHLEGQLFDSTLGVVVNPVLRHLPGNWKKQDFSQLRTGRSTDEHVMDYTQMAVEDFGEEAGRRAAQWVRAAGLGTYAAGAVASTLAGGAAMKALGAGAGAAGAAGTTGTALVPVSQGASMVRGARTAQGIYNGVRMAQPMSRGAAALRVLGNGALNAAKAVPNAQRWAQGLHAASELVTEGGMTDSKWRQGAGNILNTASEIAAYNPAFTAGTAVLGAAGTAAGLAGRFTVPGMRWARSVTDITGRPITGFMEAATKAAYRGVVKDVANGIKYGIINDGVALSEGNKPQGTVYQRYAPFFTYRIPAMVSSPILSKNDNMATMIHAGTAMEMQQMAIDRYMADPNAVAMFKERLGDPDMPDDKVRELLPDLLAGERYQNTMAQVCEKLDGDFDWRNATPEEYKAKWDSFTPGQRADAVYSAYRNDLVMGGYVSPVMFSDKNLSQEQRKHLLELYIQSEDNAHGGTLAGQAFRGGQQVALDAMRNSPQARKAVVGYAQGLVRDMLENPSRPGGMELDDNAKAILEALDATERRQIMEPLMTAPAGKIMELQRNMKTVQGSPLARAGEEAVMERIRTDGNFAAEFLPEYAKGVQDGTGVSPEDSARMLEFAKSMDPETLFSSMDDDKFRSFARWAMDGSKGGMLDALPEDQRAELVSRFTDAAKDRVWSMVKSDPLRNMPLAASLWASSKGWKAVGSALDNPMVFYGTLALLLGGLAWLGGGLFGEPGPGDDIVDNSQAVRWSDRQRQLLMQDLRL